MIHDETRVGMNKAESARITLKAFNPLVHYETYQEPISKSNVESLVSQYDIICDCTDNALTRYLINDTCVKLDKVLVSSAALKWEGQLSVYNFKGGPCYRCLFPNCPNPN